jgi:hypothetical protein
MFSGLAMFFKFFFFLHYVSWCVYKYKSNHQIVKKKLPNNWDYWLFAISMFWHSFGLLTLCNVVGIISRLFFSYVVLFFWLDEKYHDKSIYMLGLRRGLCKHKSVKCEPSCTILRPLSYMLALAQTYEL